MALQIEGDTSMHSESESTNCGPVISSQNADYPSGDADMADKNGLFEILVPQNIYLHTTIISLDETVINVRQN